MCDENGVPHKKFWDAVLPFLNDKGSHGNENYTLLENRKPIRDNRNISEIFNDHYINIIENITGGKQEGSHFADLNNKEQIERERILEDILQKCSQHPSLLNIKTNIPSDRDVFQFSKAKPSDIIKIIRGIKSGISVGVDNIPPKLVILSAEIIAEPLTNLINSTMLTTVFFQMLKRKPLFTSF